MGNKQTVFSEEQLDEYQNCTFFSRKDILRIYHRFRDLAPETVPADMTSPTHLAYKMSVLDLERMPEFRENPFRRRIFETFSQDGLGNLTFDDFLDVCSVFSENTPRDVKANYAFKIYDYDGDNHLGKSDLSLTLSALTRNELSDEEVNFVCEKVLEEADLDDDGQLSYTEFEHLIERSPDFVSLFHIRI